MKKLAELIKVRNQDSYRLTQLTDTKDITDEYLRNLIVEFYKGDRVYKAVGILVNSILTHQKGVFILSRNDMDVLIKKHSLELQGDFEMKSGLHKDPKNKSKTVYHAFTYLIESELGIIKFIKKSEGRSPSIVEVVNSELLSFIYPVEEDDRVNVINAVCKTKFSSMDQFFNSQFNNTTSQQDFNSSIHQVFNASSENRHQNRHQVTIKEDKI